ncbi:hyaluronidase-1-like isoform X1 [Pelobates fuscus]|uniref:hyaluronidase-1-like isoform X1 n=2 Tax=Pelobates fuscus TaxID=191477 RepID=UPI002FE46923
MTLSLMLFVSMIGSLLKFSAPRRMLLLLLHACSVVQIHGLEMPSQTFYKITLCVLLPLSSFFFIADSDPVLSDQPFTVVWNAPTQSCLEKFRVEIDVEKFDIVLNNNHSFLGNKMVIFYSTQLGHYPYYDKSGKPINGGLPQNASIEKHLHKARQDLAAVIFTTRFKGVAVVDWENWRPLWTRNWNEMIQYKLRSIELAYRKYPKSPYSKLKKLARLEFEYAAQAFMRRTLELGREISPEGLWGFYGYPRCFNYGYGNSSSNYTGECADMEKSRNNHLAWLWRASRALYPDIYLDKELKMSPNVGSYVKHRVKEGLRISNIVPGQKLPVLPYARIVYKYSMDFLTQEDLIQTIGQSAALGAAGVILWGNGDYSVSKESCLAVKAYLHDTLGKYLKNVTSAADQCSQSRCAGHGRCAQKDSSSKTYLHLDPKIFTIKEDPKGKGYFVHPVTPNRNITQTWREFECHCYKDWEGPQCTKNQT